MENYREKDKNIAAFLLLCEEIKFLGTHPEFNTLYFIFTPSDKASRLVDLYIAKQAPLIQPKDFAEASETILDLIWRWRKSRDGNGGQGYGKENSKRNN